MSRKKCNYLLGWLGGVHIGGIIYDELFTSLFGFWPYRCSVSHEKNSIIDLTDTENAILFTTYIK